MGLPIFRFTFSHDNLGTIEVSEPDGWKDAKLKLERHPDFHSLVEYFEGSFVHYGENNVDIGGADFIRQCESLYGFNTEIREEIDVTFDGVNYENIFTGIKDLTGLSETQDNKIDVPTIPKSLWSTFISRLDVPVDLRSTTDLDGNPVDPVEPIDINLTAQKVRMRYEAVSTTPGITEEPATVIVSGDYYQISFDNVSIGELDDFFVLPQVTNSVLPQPWIVAKYGGSYTFEIQTCAHDFDPAFSFGVGEDLSDYIRFYINIDGTETEFTIGRLFTASTINGGRVYNLNVTVSLNSGSTVSVYGRAIDDLTATPGVYAGQIRWNGPVVGLSGGQADVECYAIVSGDTTFPSTDAKGFYLHDVFAGIVQRILGTNSFYSEVLGRTDTNMRTYASNGCYSNFALIKGLHIRGYLLEEKIFSISFMQAWNGADPIFNLSLRKYSNLGTEYIRIDRKQDNYDASSVSVQIDNIRTISREYDHDKIYNSIQIGYSKWQSEDISGNDDVQTKREYSTIVRRIKNKLILYSNFIAASIAIETTRRKTIEKNKDHKFDDDTFIITLYEDDVSPDRYRAETNEHFNSISGLLNPESRYNTVLSPVRNLLRWGNVINGCLQKYQSSSLKFVSGEGNYDMVSDYSCGTGKQCLAVICDSISESQDIELGAPSNYGGVFGYLHLPLLYTIEIINFSWDDYTAIRDNPTLAISISQSVDEFKRFFIKELTFELCKSKCRIMAWAYDESPIRVIGTDMPVRDFDDDTPVDCDGDRLRILEDGDDRITEDGECRVLEDGFVKYIYHEAEGEDAEYIYNDSEIPPADTDYFYNYNET